MTKNKSVLELIIAILLSFIGGFIELYSIQLSGVFSGMQTGNLIYTMTDLIDGDLVSAGYHALMILIFFIGILLAEFLKLVLLKKKIRVELFSITIQIILLLPLLFIKVQKIESSPLPIHYICSALLTLFSAFQYFTFRELHGHTYATTMMTNLLSNLAKNFADFIKFKDKSYGKTCLDYLSILIFFCSGAITVYAFIVNLNNSEQIKLTLLIPIFILLAIIYPVYRINKAETKE